MDNTCKLMYSEFLVQRVNELYHNFIVKKYDYFHPEIFRHEKRRWKRITKKFLIFNYPITLVDLGSGTGFVPLTIAKLLKKEDNFICSDISEEILHVAAENIKKFNFICHFKFIKIVNQVPLRLPFKTKSIDIVTMNSVLHHIKDTNTFLNEIDRILKPNGLLFIGHEPNKYFFNHKFLWYNYSLLNCLINAIYDILKRLPLKRILKKTFLLEFFKKSEILNEHNKIANKINDILLKEKLIKNPLAPQEIWKIRDVKALDGFKPDLLLPNFMLLLFETYNHLFWITNSLNNMYCIRIIDNLLRKKYPHKGATFFVVLKKIKK